MSWDLALRAVLSLALVFGLILAAGFLSKRFAAKGILIGRKGATRRLAVVESLALDNRRRLLLIRKDGAEHLILIGGSNDLVVETGGRQPSFGELV
jgi:flagellar protein FliO/FliZ